MNVKRAKQIYADVLENGVGCAASINCVSLETVKRAVRKATQSVEAAPLGGAIAKRNLKKAEDKSDASRISKWSEEKRLHLAQPFFFDFFLGTSDIGDLAAVHDAAAQTT